MSNEYGIFQSIVESDMVMNEGIRDFVGKLKNNKPTSQADAYKARKENEKQKTNAAEKERVTRRSNAANDNGGVEANKAAAKVSSHIAKTKNFGDDDQYQRAVDATMRHKRRHPNAECTIEFI